MIIAVDIRGKEDYQHFIYETFKRITTQYAEHSFIFIFDKPSNSSFIFSKNIISVIVQQPKISLLSSINFKISSQLKKYKVQVLVTAKPINTKVPQYLIAFENLNPVSLKRAQVIVADSEFSKKEIVENYKIDENKIDVVYKGVAENFQPLNLEEREKIKEKYADGYEYFLIAGAVQPGNLLKALKAFSVFKKMQKSNMQLLIVLGSEGSNEFIEKLKLFKYKTEVKILTNLSEKELTPVTASAYAFIHPSSKEYSNLFKAMKCNVPVVTSNTGALPEVCGDAALYFDLNNYKDIADKMMLVYKDEKLRQQLIEKGKDQIKKYTWNKTADSLWKSIEKAGR